MQPPAILTPMYPSQEPYASIRTAQTPGDPFFDPGHELCSPSPPDFDASILARLHRSSSSLGKLHLDPLYLLH